MLGCVRGICSQLVSQYVADRRNFNKGRFAEILNEGVFYCQMLYLLIMTVFIEDIKKYIA